MLSYENNEQGHSNNNSKSTVLVRSKKFLFDLT